MADEFKPGELVRLKSGGPTMTVKWFGGHLTDTDIKACCTWFEMPKNVLKEEVFEPATLELVEPKRGPNLKPTPSGGATWMR